MASRMDDIMRLCREISGNNEIEVTVKYSVRGGLVAGVCTVGGGLLGGPPGLLAGGTVGSLLAWLTSSQFRPLHEILLELPSAQQQKLYNQITAVLGNLNWMDAAQLIKLVMGNATLQQQVTAALLNYVTMELRLKVRRQN